MSRHELSPRSGSKSVVKAVVGWDRPLQTFFVQVFTRTKAEPDEGEATVWHGTEPGELATPEAAIALAAPFVDVPPGLADMLAADMRGTIGMKDGAHQSGMKRRLFGPLH